MKNLTKLAIAGLACATLAIGAGFTAADDHGKKKGHEKQATSETVQIGAQAPAFELTDVMGNTHNLQTYLDEGKVIVLEWFNPECPFVVKQYERTNTMMDTYNYAMENGDGNVVWLAINSGAEGKQGHGIDKNKEYHTKWNMKQPILIDESGKVGKLYGAKTTPHMYVIDGTGALVYAGAIDNNPNPTQAGDTNYVINALEAVFAGETVATSTSRPYGCSVKYAK